ncbi:hypothetical protein A2526_00310 [candidate division WOR-1 bacterium RIFOXYD2_FULL_36_8]|nr:MAG: hypothetical protein A2526_00310 [candidate division WOR-1 bacterium RIFOXYD2_FULL_36_8]
MKRTLLIIAIIFIIFVSFSLISLFLQTGKNSKTLIIEIKQGTSATTISDMLAKSQIIRSKTGFKIGLKLLLMQEKIKAGNYEFKPNTALIEILLKLRNGKTIEKRPLRVTFPEGTSIYKMGSILEKMGVSNFQDFRELTYTNLTKNEQENFFFLRLVDSYSLEGFLFPDTYIFDSKINTNDLARLMLKRFSEIIWTYWEENKKDAKLSFYKTLIMASIIEKEAALEREKPIIASVFYNRLEKKMPLAADPTIKYALEQPTKKVYTSQLRINSPYNTYKNKELPPTPICNPGLESFQAAIHPKNTNYLFFVAQKDGSHIFSTSWKEHQKARHKVNPDYSR